jgi:hypothetical protein
VFGAMVLAPRLSEPAEGQTLSTISIRLVAPLGSDTSRVGDLFTAILAEPLVIGGRIVGTKDALVTGQVRQTVRSGGSALITIRLRSIQSPGARYPLQTLDLTVKADSHAAHSVLIIGGSAGPGAVRGGAASGSNQAGSAASADPGSGNLSSLLTSKRQIKLSTETVLTFYITTATINPKELAQLQRDNLASPAMLKPAA